MKKEVVILKPVSSGREDLKEATSTWHLFLSGIVQGVGFRPAIAMLAKQLHLHGYVCNASDGLHIEFNATKEKANIILDKLLGQAPPLANILKAVFSQVDTIAYKSFTIIESNINPTTNTPLTPDFALCEKCRNELNNINNRRHQYPFITCTACGPRYSIIQQMPYDRTNTSMNGFHQCVKCEKEYDDIYDRRYFSQTNSCTGCGIQLSLYKAGLPLTLPDSASIIDRVVQALAKGNIVAVKGIGGFLLLCDAANSDTIKRLRQRKHRPAKPFAVMFKDIEQATTYVTLNDKEKKILLSAVSPAVLAKLIHGNDLAVDDIAPGLHTLAVIIPYAPLFQLILSAFNKPVIATSANLSNSPIIFEDNEALIELRRIADYVLLHNREIMVPQDDSVVRYSPVLHTPIILRRSRGMAPCCFAYQYFGKKTLLATGALMKSSFTIASNRNVYVSQYLGNTDGYEARLSYTKTLNHLLGVLHSRPQLIVTDKHPGYFSHELAKNISIQYNAPLIAVQHHKAHFAAVLAENHLLKSEEPVLGVIWDGTGLGDDGQIWGGEFFTYANNNMLRCFHVCYTAMLLGDKMAKEPRLSALAFCNTIQNAAPILQPKFTAAEWSLYQSMIKQEAIIQCSSVGRMFDAVASLLGICDHQFYEGEAALLLETMAQQYVDSNGYDLKEHYHIRLQSNQITTGILFTEIIQDISKGKPVEWIAAKFHYSLIKITGVIAALTSCKKIAFSGGVFQNALLVDWMQLHLSGQYQLYFHQGLSPNDENISFGQLVYADQDIDQVNRSAATTKESLAPDKVDCSFVKM